MHWTPLSSFDFHHTLEDTPGLALVVLTSPGCGACRRVKVELRRATPARPVTFFEVDVSKSPGIAQALEVFHLPAMFLYVDGDYHAVVHAEARADRLTEAIDAMANGPATEEP